MRALHRVQRVFVQPDGGLKIIDNIPIEKARALFEEGVKFTTDPLIAELKRKAWEAKDYQPTEEELAAIRDWLNKPEIYLTEGDLQRIYDFADGSVWDFLLNVLGVRKIPTAAERIEAGFEQYLVLHNFTPEQVEVLRRIKDAFVANISSGGKVDVDAIFANPIYSRIVGRFEEVNGRFDGKLKEVVTDTQHAFKAVA